jgi:protein-S-isoprenylcysteine O-methyltransferase Ste14
MRHPLYSASYLFLAAYFLFKPYIGSAIFTLVGFIYLYVGAKWEEKKLVKQFGDTYLDYQKKVPMFWPFW